MAFALVFVQVSEWFGPKNPTDVKLSIYESGMEPVKSARERISVKYYMVTMLFIVFDIEVVFLYPWAVNFRELGLFGFVEMLIFILILFIGLIYIWKKDALKWD
jgi:NADH-quinone oxidoreductase subunit A